MPGELLSLRLIGTSVSMKGFSSMNIGAANFQSSRGISVFNRVFPFKLKYMSLSGNLGKIPVMHTEESKSGARNFSSSSFRPRNGDGGGGSRGRGGRSSGYSRGGRSGGAAVERGEFEGGSRRGHSKSLIEDEAELSDWVSELKTDTFRVGLNSDSDGDADIGSRSRGRGGEGRGGRGSFSSSRNQRGGGDGMMPAKRRRDGDADDFGSYNARGSRGGAGAGSFSRNSRGSMAGPGLRRRPSDSESDEVREFSPRGRGIGSRGARSSPANRGGRNSQFNNGQSRGGGTLQRGGRDFGVPTHRKSFDDDSEDDVVLSGRSSRKQAFPISEDDEEDVDDDDDEEDEDEDDDEEDSDIETFEDVISLNKSSKGNGAQPLPKVSNEETPSYLSQSRFDQCSVSPLSLKGIKDAGYEYMTIVQEATLPVILKGKDVLAKARTGTGKTVAFLLPAIEVIVKSSSVDRNQKRPPIYVLVICPTRELASQAAAEANTLLKYHPTIGVQVVIGGTRLSAEQKRLQANPCQILIATPGRLRDHTENTAGFATRLMGVKVLVLDEADQLLDMGFRKDIERIITLVPKQRQTLLFSATVPPQVRQICHIALNREHEYINTVQEGSQDTHSQVKQMHLVAPADKHFSILYTLLKEHIADDVDYKVLLFCTTAMITRLVANLLSELNMNVREIHSRKPQSYRTRVSDEFRKSKGLILVTSDVSARGVDYPDVTLVIQFGMPSEREQYIHRLGRTGRKGKEGEGILLLAPYEESFLSKIKDLPITKGSAPSVDPDSKKKVERALSQVEMKNKEAAYQAWLGFYNSAKNVARDKCHLVELANEFSRSMGLANPPAISKQVVGKMGLRNTPGLRVQ